jgi:hypothetical protein
MGGKSDNRNKTFDILIDPLSRIQGLRENHPRYWVSRKSRDEARTTHAGEDHRSAATGRSGTGARISRSASSRMSVTSANGVRSP